MSKLDDACRRYLSSRTYTLWGVYDLSHEDRRELAVEWLAEQVRQVLEEMANEFVDRTNVQPLLLTVFGEPI